MPGPEPHLSPSAPRSEVPIRFAAVLPAYERARILPRALDSALAQSHPPAEIWVVDDGSTDDTADVVAGYGGQVQYVHQNNAGAAAARNHGARKASAPWIAFLDSDDVWLPDHLERTARAIEGTQGRAELYFADLRYDAQRDHKRLWEAARFEPASPYELAEDGGAWMMSPVQPVMLQSSVFARDTFLEIGGIWEQLAVREDTHLFHLLSTGRAVCSVSGVSTEMYDDADQRLTRPSDEQRARYLDASARLYADLLARRIGTSEQRREFARRRAHAELGLAGIALRGGARLEAVGRTVRGLACSPGYAWRRGTRWLRRKGG